MRYVAAAIHNGIAHSIDLSGDQGRGIPEWQSPLERSQKQMTDNISEMIRNGACIVQVSAADLKDWAQDLLDQHAQRQKKPQEEILLTTAQASRFLNVDRSTLWRWNRENYLKPVMIGNRYRYRQSDLESLKSRRS